MIWQLDYGDERMYGHIVIVRVVESADAMTANWTRLPYNLIGNISNRITNEVDGITWVTYANIIQTSGNHRTTIELLWFKSKRLHTA